MKKSSLGQALTEYTMCASLLTLVALPALLFLGESANNMFTGMGGKTSTQTSESQAVSNTPNLPAQKADSAFPSFKPMLFKLRLVLSTNSQTPPIPL